jgi:tetratricopeptide (TPR) repeat protein
MSRRLVALLAIVASCGCASAHERNFASRFIREGTPTVDLGGPRPDTPRMPQAPLADATIRGNVSRIVGTSLENFDATLQAAIGRVIIAPTIEHHLGASRAYRQQGIMDHALDYLNRSLAVNGPSAIVYDERARLWRDWGYAAEGLADAYRAVYLAPESPAFRNTLGTVLYRIGQADDALDQFEQVVRLEPNAWYALANLCYVHSAQGRTREAIPLCRRATTLRKQQARAR